MFSYLCESWLFSLLYVAFTFFFLNQIFTIFLQIKAYRCDLFGLIYFIIEVVKTGVIIIYLLNYLISCVLYIIYECIINV